MPATYEKLSQCFAKSLFPGELQQDALAAHLALANRLVTVDRQTLNEMSDDTLLKADAALAVVDRWLLAWRDVVGVARERAREGLAENIVVLSKPSPDG